MHNPNVKWDDIIGLEAAKRTIKEAVVYPIKVNSLVFFSFLVVFTLHAYIISLLK
jgi:SpoVK/Ycf46/Vps4 family AAA+-type ATPase